MIMQSNMTMTKHVIINGTMESRMEIYLRMAMENAIIGRYVAVLRKVYGGFMVPAKVARYKRG